jgi:hypothetical protein
MAALLYRRDPMKMLSPRSVVLALLLFGAAGGASAEMFKCLQVDGGISFQQLPCADGVPIAPAPAEAPKAASATAALRAPDPPSVIPTKRMRELLDLTALLERCRADEPGFSERSAPLYQAWRVRHAVTLTTHKALLTAKVREYRRGGGGMPPQACSDDWLHSLEPLARMPDARFSSVEKTWTLFVDALKAADRTAALNCLAGPAEARWRARVTTMGDADLRRIGGAIRAFKVQWGDDYLKEALAAGDDNRVSGIAFRSINEEWKISEF